MQAGVEILFQMIGELYVENSLLRREIERSAKPTQEPKDEEEKTPWRPESKT